MKESSIIKRERTIAKFKLINYGISEPKSANRKSLIKSKKKKIYPKLNTVSSAITQYLGSCETSH